MEQNLVLIFSQNRIFLQTRFAYSVNFHKIVIFRLAVDWIFVVVAYLSLASACHVDMMWILISYMVSRSSAEFNLSFDVVFLTPSFDRG